MAPKQKTFELIPDPVGHPGQGNQACAALSKPPMTTKQAKKLYRQKNKGPKLSKAEQRRIELMEQDRIRKEFEKEKAQARARTARERKKEKEEKEKEERRRKGLPLVDIHPSQDTISNFINRMGFGRKPISNGGKYKLEPVQETGSETVTEGEADTETDGGDAQVEGENEDEDAASDKENQQPSDDTGERPAKRRRTVQPNGKSSGQLLDRMIHIPSQRPAGPVPRIAQGHGTSTRPRASSVDTDDAATEAMLEDQLIADVELASSRSMANSSPIRPTPVKEAALTHVPAPKSMPAAPTLHQQAQRLSPEPPPIQQQPQLPKSLISDDLHTTKTAVSTHVRTHHGEGVFKKPISPFVSHVRDKAVIKSPAISVPSVPPRFKAPVEPQNSKFARPRFLPPHVQAPRSLPVQASPTYAGSRRTVIESASAFPTSTQLFVLNHADELFPSASQEAQELLEDQLPAVKARPIARPSSLVQKSPAPPSRTVAALRPVTTSHPPPPYMSHQQEQPPPPKTAVSLECPFLSTQDFILSSQDMMELETPNKVREDLKPQKTSTFASRDALSTKRQEGSAPDRRRITGLQVPTNSKVPTLSPTSHRASHVPGEKGSTSPSSGSGTGVKADIRMGQAKKVTGCPSQIREPHRPQYFDNSIDCRQPSQPPSQSASRQTSSPQPGRGRAGTGDYSSIQAVGHAPSSWQPLSSAKISQTNALCESTKDTIATPQGSPPRKRMFGSSGPGAEVLVAMERSYRENLQEKRRREDELRALASKQQETERLAREIADILDDDELSDGGIREDTKPCQPTYAGVGTTNEPRRASSSPKPSGKAELSASQETDYGDFDFDAGDEELGILADMAWVDDDLDGF